VKSIPPHWRASLVLTPIVLVSARSDNSGWLLAAIVTISAYNAMGRCRAGLEPSSIRARAPRVYAATSSPSRSWLQRSWTTTLGNILI
jgi:hypothetical protein